MPNSAIRRLIKTGSIAGVPDCITGNTSNDFCEDCINGKLTQVLHSKLANHTDCPLFRVFSDVHGPVPVRSRQGHYYWVTFIDDYLQFPAIYFVTNKSDIFGTFWKYKAWAENITGQ